MVALLKARDDCSAVADQTTELLVLRRLLESNIPTLRGLGACVADGTITLHGTVSSFYEKQLCAEACRGLPAVKEIVDMIEVAWDA